MTCTRPNCSIKTTNPTGVCGICQLREILGYFAQDTQVRESVKNMPVENEKREFFEGLGERNLT